MTNGKISGLASWRTGSVAPVAMLAVALVLALVASMLPITKAAAYYNFGTVGVYTGASYLTVQAGSSTSTSVSVDPSSDSQTLGCGMAKCPQVCTSEGAIEAGYTCFDANGQCTCAGSGYSTYYPEVSVSSSNSGVASAYVSGGTLVVTGNSAGTATIYVNASLRQWTSNSTSIQVQVTEPASSSGSGSGSGGSSSGSGSGSGSGGSDSPATVPSTSTPIPGEAAATDSRDDAPNETVTETVAGKVYSAENNGFLNTREELEKIVGTTDQAVFWAGLSVESPKYSWTFVGDQVDKDSAYLEFDPTITVSKLGTGYVSNLMKQAKDGLVLEFAHHGDLPGTTTIYVNVDGTFADGQSVGLFCYNEDERCFEAVGEDKLDVQGGYVSFKMTHCSTWALSTDDLASYRVEEVNTPRAIAADEPVAASEGTTPLIVAGAVTVVVVAVAAIVAGVVISRKKKQDRKESTSDAES